MTLEAPEPAERGRVAARRLVRERSAPYDGLSAMTRRKRRGAAFAAISAAVLLLASLCRAAGVYPQTAPPDLSRLTFVPSFVSAAPSAIARSPEPARDPGTRAAERARTDRAISDQLEFIHEQEARDGIFSRDLADELAALAALYQERGDHEVALGLLDRARQIVRVNDGLFTLDQAPMIRQAIASREALHEREGTTQSLDELLRLARRNPNDARIAEIYDEVADARVEQVERYLDGEELPHVQISIGFGETNPTAGEPPGVLAQRTLFAAQVDYGRAIRAILLGPSIDAASLQGLEADLVKTYYLQNQYFKRFNYQQPTSHDRDRAHALGVNSYLRRIRYSEALLSPDSEIATELLELGDWHLLFGQRDPAFAAYRTARDMLVRDGAMPKDLEAFFSPTTAILLPTFAAGFVDDDHTAAYRGYIGVAIALDGNGKSTQVDVTERSTEATDAIVQRLKKHVAKSVFRPKFVDGDWLAEDHVSLRYYFTY